jgi:hypothetical protein
MQQVYDASAFTGDISEGGWITGVWFVSDSVVGRGWTAALPKVEIMLGTTSKGPDELSATFAENFAIAPTVVRPLGDFVISTGGPGAAVEISFMNPFFYDPSAGNLLMEIKNYEPTGRPGDPLGNAGPLDAWNVTGDAVSRVYARGDANAPVGTVDTVGLTTLFVFQPIPEPSTIALMGLGAITLIWRWRKRSARTAAYYNKE